MARVAQRVGGQTTVAETDPSIPECRGDGERVGPSDRGRDAPQGGPLSPLLSNLVLDDLDRELEPVEATASCPLRG